MNIIGFNFTKINASRDIKVKTLEKISSNIEVIEITRDSLSVLKDTDIAKINFKFTIHYEQKYAELGFEGTILLAGTEEEVKEILKSWKKKLIEEKVKIPLFNAILNKCSLKALQLEDEIGIPQHIKLPRITSLQKKG